MKHQAVIELFEYWNDLRGERTAPERNDIDPGAIRHILADTFMLDIDTAARFPFRLAGTRVNAVFDAEQKGRSFLDIWAPDERRSILGILLTVANDACPVVAGTVAAPGGHPGCPFEILLLPMRHHGKTHSRILGIIKTARPPAWLGMLPVGGFRLHSLRIVDGDERDHTTLIRDGETPPPAPAMKAATARALRGPFLRVIEGGRERLQPRNDRASA